MASDMVVAVGTATVNGHTFFGCNSHGPAGACQTLTLNPGRAFALGEMVQAEHLQLPQARQTYTVLGGQPLNTWGYRLGINEHQLAVGCTSWCSKMPCAEPGLTGTDLVRLALERCRGARQAFDLIVGLLSRHGQGVFSQGGGKGEADHIFVLADATEACVIEAAGSFWASVECNEARAVSDLGLIRQDWHRLAPGLAEHVIGKSWWPDDGSKLDFGASLAVDTTGTDSALRRWGRATLLLEQHNGRIDAAVLRRLLSDHYEGTRAEVDPLAPAGPTPLCRHATRANPSATNASFIAEMTAEADSVPMAWCAFGPPCMSVYLPIFLEGELPEALSRNSAPGSLWWRMQATVNAMREDGAHRARLRSSFAQVQARFDQEAEEFRIEAVALKRNGEQDVLRRQAGLFMQGHVEQLEAEFQRLQVQGPVVESAAAAVGAAVQ
jgi:secernin